MALEGGNMVQSNPATRACTGIHKMALIAGVLLYPGSIKTCLQVVCYRTAFKNIFWGINERASELNLSVTVNWVIKYCIIALTRPVICRSFEQNVNKQSTLIGFALMLLYAGSNVCYNRAREFRKWLLLPGCSCSRCSCSRGLLLCYSIVRSTGIKKMALIAGVLL